MSETSELPSIRLNTGAEMPGIGLGTFGSDRYSAAEVAQAVSGAIRAGYRHIDCAAVYGNEAAIGEALADAWAGGASREKTWITSKVWNDSHGPGRVIASCLRSLQDLRLEYLDLLLIHWPFPNHHAAGVGGDARDAHARPYIHDEYMVAWRQMEELARMGLARNIGTSNMTIPKLRLLLRDAEILPAVNEMELHPHFQQPELFDYVVSQGIAPVAYSPLGSPSRPARDRDAGDTADMDDPVIARVARRLGVHPAAVCLKWAVQRGQVPIPFAANPAQYAANLQAAAGPRLMDEEMREIAAIDRGSRLIKGQVFLWPGARDWRDLWDEDGVISS